MTLWREEDTAVAACWLLFNRHNLPTRWLVGLILEGFIHDISAIGTFHGFV